MTRTRLALAALILLATAAPGHCATYYAVVVGISEYSADPSNNLNYCDDDAQGVYDALLASPNWSASNIRLITDQAATKSAITSAINTMVATATADDVILYYHSSHGSNQTDTAPLDEADGMDEIICTTDFINFTDDELGDLFAPARTKNLVVLLDTCFSGGQIKAGLPAGAVAKTISLGTAPAVDDEGLAADFAQARKRYLARTGQVVPADLDDNGFGVAVTAADDDEYSYETAQFENGVFTEFLLKAITKVGDSYPGDTSGNKWVSAEEAFAYVDAAVSASAYSDQHTQMYDANTSTQLDFVGEGDLPPAAAKSVVAADTTGVETASITVTWTKSKDDGRGANDVTGYSVERAASKGGPFSSIKELAPGSTVYVDTAVTNSKDYWYMVVTHDPAYSTDSAVAGPAQSRDDVAPAAVTELAASDTPADEGGSVTLTWDGYAVPADFSHYNVYRSTSSFTSVHAVGVTKISTITDPAVQACVDLDVVNGTRYWYSVTAVDLTRDAVAPGGNELTTVATVGPVEASPNYTFSYPPGNSIIAIGADASASTLAELFGVDAADLKIARWDPAAASYAKYWETPGDPLFTPLLGRGFWLASDAALMLEVSGQPAPTGNSKVAFAPGWNMLGNPYTAALDITNATVTVGSDTMTLGEAATKGYTRDYMWAYDAFAKSYKLISPSIPWASKEIARGRGVFFRAFTSGTLTLPRPTGAAEPAGSAASAPEAVVAGWKLRIVAQTAAGRDEDNFVGVSAQATALNRVANAPAVGVDVALVGADGTDGAAYFVTPGAGNPACGIRVTATEAGPVRLSWPDLSLLPSNLRPVLTDLATGKRLYLRTTPSYGYEAEAAGTRMFRLDISEAGGMLVVRTLAAAPTGRGAQVAFTLSADAQVSVDVLNAAGRPIRSLLVGSAVAGGSPVVAAWDGANSGGAHVPNGRYLVRLTARTDDGQQASSVATLTLGR
jgi:hypothetical protein